MPKTLAVVLAFDLALSIPAMAQGETTGAIVGSVSDQTGAAIPGAMVTVTNIENGLKRSVTTDDAGRFSFPQLKPGVYAVKAEADRFETQQNNSVAAGLGQRQTVDFRLDIIQSHEDYARITVKTVGTLAWRIFYDPLWPVGLLFPWPIPQASIYELHVGFKVVLPRFQSLQQQINFPPEYETALNWCGARRLRASYQMPADPTIDSLARDSLNTIRLANQAMPTLRLPDTLTGRNRSYDYRSDGNG